VTFEYGDMCALCVLVSDLHYIELVIVVQMRNSSFLVICYCRASIFFVLSLLWWQINVHIMCTF